MESEPSPARASSHSNTGGGSTTRKQTRPPPRSCPFPPRWFLGRNWVEHGDQPRSLVAQGRRLTAHAAARPPGESWATEGALGRLSIRLRSWPVLRSLQGINHTTKRGDRRAGRGRLCRSVPRYLLGWSAGRQGSEPTRWSSVPQFGQVAVSRARVNPSPSRPSLYLACAGEVDVIASSGTSAPHSAHGAGGEVAIGLLVGLPAAPPGVTGASRNLCMRCTICSAHGACRPEAVRASAAHRANSPKRTVGVLLRDEELYRLRVVKLGERI